MKGECSVIGIYHYWKSLHLRWVSGLEPTTVVLTLWPEVNDLSHSSTKAPLEGEYFLLFHNVLMGKHKIQLTNEKDICKNKIYICFLEVTLSLYRHKIIYRNIKYNLQTMILLQNNIVLPSLESRNLS